MMAYRQLGPRRVVQMRRAEHHGSDEQSVHARMPFLDGARQNILQDSPKQELFRDRNSEVDADEQEQEIYRTGPFDSTAPRASSAMAWMNKIQSQSQAGSPVRNKPAGSTNRC